MGKELKKHPQSPQKLPALMQVKQAVSQFVAPEGLEKAHIPNASLIYGAGAAALFAFAFYHFVMGQMVFSVLLAFLGGVMFAYAVFFIRSMNNKGRK